MENKKNKYCWFRVAEAAKYARVSLRTIERWISIGKLKTVKPAGGRIRLIRQEWIDSVILFNRSNDLTKIQIMKVKKL